MGIYMHVPFCARSCDFCHFYQEVPKRDELEKYVSGMELALLNNPPPRVADTVFWGPVQIAGSVGMLLGHRWGFLLALIASVPFWYSAILIYIWDRDVGFRKNILLYWVFVWGMFPAFGVVEMVYCVVRLVQWPRGLRSR